MAKLYRNYNKLELIEKVDSLSITKNQASQIITRFNDKIISISNVSNRYEIFDIKSYIKSKIDFIEKNFNISKYSFTLKGGIQSLHLLSDKIEIEGIEFYKSFFLLSSSDRTRSLSFYSGLYSETKNLYIINSTKNLGLNKKHLKGITEKAEVESLKLNDETFNEQIESIKSLVGHKILLSKIKDVIVDNKDVKINHSKFDAFKNSIINLNRQSRLKLTNEQLNTLSKPSKDMVIDRNEDFYLDAFWVFQNYLSIFNRQDSHIIKKETDKIMNITQWAVRNQQLETLGI